MYTDSRKASHDFKILVGIIGCLVLIGLIFVYSSSSVYALEFAHDAAYFFKKQLLGLVLGCIAAIVLSRLSLNRLYRLTPYIFLGALALTMLTFIPGFAHRIHGSSRWLNLGGVMFQPSELLKWAVVLYTAAALARKEDLHKSMVKRYIPVLLVLITVSLVLLKQPDFGLMVTIGATVLCLLFIAYSDWKYVLALLAAAIPVGGLLIYLEPYRLKRMITFLNPWQDPQGAGFQVIQSLIAVGSGRLCGVGISHSRQKFFYLPMQHTDFIFSIIAEETGFLGSFFVIFLYLALLYQGMRLAWELAAPFARYVVLGFTIMVNLQAIINIAVAVGLFPTKGIGLPFVSYGNSSLLCSVAMLGIIAACVREV